MAKTEKKQTGNRFIETDSTMFSIKNPEDMTEGERKGSEAIVAQYKAENPEAAADPGTDSGIETDSV
jgi:hypothetical protein